MDNIYIKKQFEQRIKFRTQLKRVCDIRYIEQLILENEQNRNEIKQLKKDIQQFQKQLK